MPEENSTSEFIDQIIQYTLQKISENPVFDDEALARLKELAGSSGLTSFERVMDALSAGEGN